MAKQMLKEMKQFVNDQGVVWELDFMAKFMQSDSDEERSRVQRAMYYLIESGEVVWNPVRPIGFLSSSDRFLH